MIYPRTTLYGAVAQKYRAHSIKLYQRLVETPLAQTHRFYIYAKKTKLAYCGSIVTGRENAFKEWHVHWKLHDIWQGRWLINTNTRREATMLYRNMWKCQMSTWHPFPCSGCEFNLMANRLGQNIGWKLESIFRSCKTIDVFYVPKYCDAQLFLSFIMIVFM